VLHAKYVPAERVTNDVKWDRVVPVLSWQVL
jgi:hypothetical protein